jgi:hypothetical protein
MRTIATLRDCPRNQSTRIRVPRIRDFESTLAAILEVLGRGVDVGLSPAIRLRGLHDAVLSVISVPEPDS